MAVNFCFAAHALNSWTEAQRRNLQHQSVAGNYRPAKTRFPDAGEQHELSIAIGDFAQRENRAALRQGLDDHHAGHYGRSRKVALKERFIDADLFDADDPLQRFQFDDAINK